MSGPLGDAPGALTLVIEASSVRGSVALLDGHTARAHRTFAMGASQADALFPAVGEVMAACQLMPNALQAIACGSGPGSFTSLRIAASVAKGFAHAVSLPLFAVPSLLLAAASCRTAGQFVVHSDALRDERYAMLVRVDAALMVHAESDAQRVTRAQLSVWLEGREELVVSPETGNDGKRCVLPDAASLLRVYAWRGGGPVSLAAWEPEYGRKAEAQVRWEAVHQRTLDPRE